MNRIRLLAAGVLCAAAALASATAAPAASPLVVAASGATITIHDFAFHPGTLRVRRGTTVTVVNHDTTNHSFTASSGRFDLSRLGPGRHGRVRLTHAGTYHYFCAFHNFMRGTIVVR
jgi:plastocyanin